jgi:hypothetical protein
MKKVVSVSLGSAKGDFQTTVRYLGQDIEISRTGTNGSLTGYAAKLRELDGKVDAIGLGGADMYVYAGGRRYTFREISKLAALVKQTPVVDGSGLKNTLERECVRYLNARGIVHFSEVNTLMVCAVDRFGMAEEIAAGGGPAIYGDLMFALGLPIPIRSFGLIRPLAALILPVAVRLPFRWLYPTGPKQDVARPRFGWAYSWADVIAGDRHMIRRRMPEGAGSLAGKTIITNTTTAEFRDEIARRGAKRLITTTPAFGGRSPGTNVMEAAIVAASGSGARSLTPDDFSRMLEELHWKPEVTEL